MAKTRISISLKPEDAELIRKVAAEHGLDVSAFLVRAAHAEAERLAEVAAAFARIDARIAAVEAEAEALEWPPQEDLDPAEVARVEAEIAAAEARSESRRRARRSGATA
ncbi:DUF1778 domain-containing protein [Streptomyces sp. NPDC090025]|uniref:type II toxin -antitoxin system TacA 1-like antitoxin n=1 Tax=Streptomyces sp. NPDC090025 TaxID=3365922 RepID=UPI003836CC57